ncbi:MAG: four helix bundle protein [Clostridiaceae bacterium]|nr:four helix bundle protein [Clostridiaceae bacterium]
MSSTDFRKLVVWQRSKDLAVDIYKITGIGKLAKDYSLIDQMRRASVSIPSNIAEGNDRDTNKESVRYLYIAKGSLAELMTQLVIANEFGYLEETEFNELEEKCMQLSKSIGALIKARKGFRE